MDRWRHSNGRRNLVNALWRHQMDTFSTLLSLNLYGEPIEHHLKFKSGKISFARKYFRSWRIFWNFLQTMPVILSYSVQNYRIGHIKSMLCANVILRVFSWRRISDVVPESKVQGANMGPTWVLSSPDGPHVGPMNFAIRGVSWWRHQMETFSA